MSRSGYTDDCEDQWALIRWRGAVSSAIRGARGQSLLRELLAALDAMPEKRLSAGNFATPEGEFCTLGVLGAKRGLDMSDLGDAEYCERELVAKRFGVAEALAAEIMYLNDDFGSDWKFVDFEVCGPMRPHYPEWGSHTRTMQVWDATAANRRWAYMRNWVARQIAQPVEGDDAGR